MLITWIGHSCFKIEKDGYAVVMDPYGEGTVPGLSGVKETADRVICSHDHFDHNAKGCVEIKDSGKPPFTITTLHSFHDPNEGSQRGTNDITIISDGTNRVAHFGDIGCKLTKEQIAELKGIDVALMPIGGTYTLDAVEAAAALKEIEPKIIIPMHYRKEFGFDVLGTVDDFTKLYDKVCITGKSSLDITNIQELTDDVYVLKPQNA